MSELDDFKAIQGKLIEKVMGVLLSIALTLSGFALNEGYKSQLQITEMKVQMTQMEKKIESVEKTPNEVSLISYKFDSLQKEMSEIRNELKELKNLLEKKDLK